MFQGQLVSSIKHQIIKDELIINDKFSIICKYIGKTKNELFIYSLRTNLKNARSLSDAMSFDINSNKQVLEFVEFLKLKYEMEIYIK